MAQLNQVLIERACPTSRQEPSLGPDAAHEFQIRSAVLQPTRRQAAALLARRYTGRGYSPVGLPQEASADRLTLVATMGERTVSTMTVRLDGPVGLAAEALFRHEVGALQRAGERLCEFGRLASEPQPHAARMLMALFQVGYLFADRLHRCDSVVMEVNPSHVGFYRRALGAQVIGSERLHPGIGAPAVLLHLPLAEVRSRLAAAWCGTPSRYSFYALGLSHAEEMTVLERLVPALASATLH